MINKIERRKRLVDDLKRIADHTGKDASDAVKFAQNIPDEVLDQLEELGFSSERKTRIDITNNNLGTKSEKTDLKPTMIFARQLKKE
jgi:hypothetical protein